MESSTLIPSFETKQKEMKIVQFLWNRLDQSVLFVGNRGEEMSFTVLPQFNNVRKLDSKASCSNFFENLQNFRCWHKRLFPNNLSLFIIAGYQLYLTLTSDDMLLEVEKTSRILWYYLFTYGLAFLIVTISIAIDPFVYTRADYCVWMEQTNVFWSTFITPIIVFIVVSIVFQLSSCCFLFTLSIRHPNTDVRLTECQMPMDQSKQSTLFSKRRGTF